MNTKEFNQEISKFLEINPQLSEINLEDYLLTLLRKVEESKEERPSLDLFYKLITESTQINPLKFDEEWRKNDDPGMDKDPESYEDVINLLKYQISELHIMKEKGMLDDPNRSMGLNSPRGQHAWFNFEIPTFLGVEVDQVVNSEIRIDWGYLAMILWLGQIYE